MHLSNGFRKYTQNTGYLLFGKIAKLLATFTVGVCLIRYLGPRQFGLFSYAISFVFLFNALANLGLDSIIVRDLVNSKDKDEILGSAFVLKLIGAVSTIVIILITINFASFNLYTKGMICVISLGMLFKSVDVIDFYFQSEVLSKYVVYAQVVSLVITSVLYLAFIYFRLPLMYFAYVFLFEFLVTSVGLLVCYKINKQKVILWKANLNRMKGLLKDSWPVIFTGLAIMVYMRIDQIMIKEMLGLEAVGHYAAAVRLSEAWHFIPLVITTSLFPAIIKAKSVSNSFYVARVQKLYDLLIWLSIIVALSTAFLSNWLVQLLY